MRNKISFSGAGAGGDLIALTRRRINEKTRNFLPAMILSISPTEFGFDTKTKSYKAKRLRATDATIVRFLYTRKSKNYEEMTKNDGGGAQFIIDDGNLSVCDKCASRCKRIYAMILYACTLTNGLKIESEYGNGILQHFSKKKTTSFSPMDLKKVDGVHNIFFGDFKEVANHCPKMLKPHIFLKTDTQ